MLAPYHFSIDGPLCGFLGYGKPRNYMNLDRENKCIVAIARCSFARYRGNDVLHCYQCFRVPSERSMSF